MTGTRRAGKVKSGIGGEARSVRPKAVITCLSDCKRGEPLTTTRHYGMLPLANTELVKHQLAALSGFAVTALVREMHSGLAILLRQEHISVIHLEEQEKASNALAAADLILPGDILPLSTLPEIGLVTIAGGSDETGIVQSMLKNVRMTEIDGLRINYSWEPLDANQTLLASIKNSIDPSVTIEEGVTIIGEVIIGKKTRIMAGSYIEGPVIIGAGCEIGPMAHIRSDTSIADGCRIGKTEVVDCIIMRTCTSKHHAYLGHSILGEDVNIGAFTVTADYRHDGQEHKCVVCDEKVATGRKKLGAFIGDHVRTAVSTSIYPGRKLWPHSTTLPGEVVKKDEHD